jgi:hypothetical protein
MLASSNNALSVQDLERVAKATGGVVQTALSDLNVKVDRCFVLSWRSQFACRSSARATALRRSRSARTATTSSQVRCSSCICRLSALDIHQSAAGCPKAKTSTVILRGGAEQFIAESEVRLFHLLHGLIGIDFGFDSARSTTLS